MENGFTAYSVRTFLWAELSALPVFIPRRSEQRYEFGRIH
jgi:hypothetical protein